MRDSTYSKYLLPSKPQKLKAERWRRGLEGDREKQGSQCAESSSLQDETPWRSDSADSPNTAERSTYDEGGKLNVMCILS